MRKLLIFCFVLLGLFSFSQSATYDRIDIRQTAKVRGWLIYQGDTLGIATVSGDTLFITKGATVDTLVAGGTNFWTLRSTDTITADYNIYLDSAFMMKAGKWHMGYTLEDAIDDNSDSLIYMGYLDYDNHIFSFIQVRHQDSGGEHYDIDLVADGTGRYSKINMTDSTLGIAVENSTDLNTIGIYPDSTVFGTENIYMPDITATGKKFEHLVGISPDGRLFPQPLASGYDSIVEYAIAAGGYGKEDVLDVGGAGEKYTDFSTAVAAAGAGDVIELSSATFTESGTVTMPTGSTLRIYEGGLLSGTFTLVGDNTRLDAGLYQCFGSGVTITGSWVVDKTYVDWFGMIGAADEGGELTAAINFCKLTTGRTLVFQCRDYYVENFITYWAGGGTIEGNGAMLHHTYDDVTEYEEFIRIYGSVGTYDTLDVNAVYGSYILTVPAGSALLNLNRGDMVKIISDESPDESTNLIGEIKIVDTVIASGRNVIFTEPLYDTYYATDNARMAEVTPGQAILKDFKVIGNPDRNYNLGVELKYIDRPLIQNVECHNFKYEAFGVQDCYNGRFDVVATNARGSTGLGYGMSIYGACMSNLITIRGAKLRHITATGGNGALGGIPYNNKFIDCIGTSVDDHGYDMHVGTGTGNKYINCSATAGVSILDTANFQSEWSGATTYDNNDIVAIAASKNNGQQLFKSIQNSNTNNNPVTDLGNYWEVYDNSINGFTIGCSGATIENCHVEGFSSGFAVVGKTMNNIHIDGLTIKNCAYGVFLENDTLQNSSINNIRYVNEVFIDDAYAIVLKGSTLNNVNYGNIDVVNGTAFYLDSCTFTNKSLNCGNVNTDVLLHVTEQLAEVHINFASAYTKAKSNPNFVIYTSTTSNGVKSININNFTVQGAATAPVNNNCRLNSLTFGNVYLIDGSTVNFIDNNDSIDRITIDYIYNDGAGALDILDNTSAYCGVLKIGNMAGTLQAVPWLKGNAIATQFIGWDGYIDVIDFKAASQYGGWIKQGGQYLINTYGSGNVGFGYKSLTQQGSLTYVGTLNTSMGYETLWNLSTSSGGARNSVFGYNSGRGMTTGSDNTAMGAYAGRAISTGTQNTVIGSYAGYSLGAGMNGNVMIGYNAGYNATGSDELYIDNSNTATPLIYGDFATDALTVNGSCSITTFLKLTPTADPPGSPAEGMIYADTDHHLYYYNGSTWVQLDN